LRPVLGGDPGRSALLVGDEVRPGMSFRLAVRDPAVGRSRLAESIAALGQDSDSPAGLLYFHSALQGQALYGLPELDTAYVRRDLGEAELAGFASYVLFAPMLGRSQFHHFSSVLVGLGCRADQVAEARVGSGPGRRIE
jgi:small ligand-binding sensory domain FIST